MYKIGLNNALFILNYMFEELIYDISLTEGNQMTLLETANTLSGKAPKNARITINKYHDDKREGIKIIDLFLNLCKNQYFGDGNKRTAQLIMCGLLILNGYAPFSINFKDIEYSKDLVNFYDDENKKDTILQKLLDKQRKITKKFLEKK